MNLQQIFIDLLLRIGFNEAEIKAHWLDLEKAYGSKNRHYHNLTHLHEMIVLFDLYVTKLKNPDEVLFAIFYHDFVYKTTRNDNELKSAQFALSILSSLQRYKGIDKNWFLI